MPIDTIGWMVRTMRKTVTIGVGAFALEALAGEELGGPTGLSETMARAIRCYVHDRDNSSTGWPYPDVLRDREPSGVALELEIDAGLWREFEEEAARQGVTVRQLAGHAAFYYVAAVDAGRIAERIFDDLA